MNQTKERMPKKEYFEMRRDQAQKAGLGDKASYYSTRLALMKEFYQVVKVNIHSDVVDGEYNDRDGGAVFKDAGVSFHALSGVGPNTYATYEEAVAEAKRLGGDLQVIKVVPARSK